MALSLNNLRHITTALRVQVEHYRELVAAYPEMHQYRTAFYQYSAALEAAQNERVAMAHRGDIIAN